ncbi:uncharacterized protein LOC126417032 [Schistocerca serialis cubense]|uniref:uncharacterized protein LOC126417032 n=1 Tax=Schistocerca serialis cubense TaxID=2023355 RepID=UPI00214EFE26|nr:uncharacterized protein LOC126417032 [Schistocerca serialis cubense]
MSPWKLCLLVALAAVVCLPTQAAAMVPAPPKPHPSSSSEESVHPLSPKAAPFPVLKPLAAAVAAPPNPAYMRHAPTPEPAPTAIDPTPYLSCSYCGRFNSLVTALLRAVYALLLALLNDVNSALCYTLHLVYILLCIIQVTVSVEIIVAVTGLSIILQTVARLPVVGALLQTIALLLTGILNCILRELRIALVY